jgi:hypothetical protein
MIADHTIVRDVRIGHQQTIAADNGFPMFFRAAIERDKLANRRALADFERRLFAAEFQILRRIAKRCAGEDAALRADTCAGSNMHVRANPAIFANTNITFNYAIRANGNAGFKLGLGINNRRRMDANHIGVSRGEIHDAVIN